MNPRNLTREAIEELNDIEPYCFETNREEQWFNVGLQYGLDVADSDPISPWISVDEDLPCNHDKLIITNCYYDGKETINVITIIKRGVVNENFMIFYDNKWEWGFSTAPCYWMPIPKLPKEQKIKL